MPLGKETELGLALSLFSFVSSLWEKEGVSRAGLTRVCDVKGTHTRLLFPFGLECFCVIISRLTAPFFLLLLHVGRVRQRFLVRDMNGRIPTQKSFGIFVFVFVFLAVTVVVFCGF